VFDSSLETLLTAYPEEKTTETSWTLIVGSIPMSGLEPRVHNMNIISFKCHLKLSSFVTVNFFINL